MVLLWSCTAFYRAEAYWIHRLVMVVGFGPDLASGHNLFAVYNFDFYCKQALQKQLGGAACQICRDMGKPEMTRPTPAPLISDTLDRAKSYSGNTYCVLLAVQGVANSMAENNLREVKITFHVSGELVTVEVKR